MAMAIKIEKQSIKFIKPFVQTPPTLSHYKLGFIDEFAPTVNIEVNVKFIDEFIPSKIKVAFQESDPLLAVQVTTFECGGVAIGISATHKIVDASTLCTFLNDWAITNQEGNEIEFDFIGFSSSLLFPTRGLTSAPMEPMNENKFTTMKLSFSESAISIMKTKGSNSTRRWSSVQVVSSIIWKAFIDADFAIHNVQRDSILTHTINLRGKMASLIPKISCGNIWGLCLTKCKTLETTQELTNHVSDSLKESVTNFFNEHHDRVQGQPVVLNSLSNTSIIRGSTNVVSIR
ncbi:hypothetical protein L1987_53247 [Smallanthus sonchifolius]|uniref:Uncharacterized protein n=1 Tax=Smallanthus sonchifolius TaxID=185202 RepID=A0ACB9EWJ3_9ASTR|nr:hypothetical protein L1987_53247 [Smallanthus sonchifolius]